MGSGTPLRRFDGLEVFPLCVAARIQHSHYLISRLLCFSRVPSSTLPLRVAPNGDSPEVFYPYSACSYEDPVHSGLPDPTPSDSRESHPLAGLRPSQPSSLISCWIRSWGRPSRLFPPPRAPIPFQGRSPSRCCPWATRLLGEPLESAPRLYSLEGFDTLIPR